MTADAPDVPVGRTQLDVMKAQLAAIDAWHTDRRAGDVAESATLTREARLDLNRRREACRRERQALLARVDAQLRESGGVLSGTVPPRAVLAHRHSWLRDNVAERLETRGITVVGSYEDGAEAVGTVVAEQPDVVLVEDRLPTLSGVEVVRRIRTFAPDAVVAAQCLDAEGVRPLVEAGAQAVFTRRIAPADVADQLVDCLSAGGRQLIAVG